VFVKDDNNFSVNESQAPKYLDSSSNSVVLCVDV